MILACTALIAACSSPGKDDTLLKEAVAVHNAMMKTASRLKKEMDAIGKDPASHVPVDSMGKLLADMEQWEAELVEVPGNEEHHHAKHEHHDHTLLMVTAQEMLDIQLDLNQRLDSIEWKFKALKGQR